MKTSSVLASLAVVLGAQGAVVPPCVHCRQDSCMDAVVQSECGDYLVIVETPATETVFETAYATVVPTQVSLVTLSTTVINNITTTIPVLAYQTVDYTVTVTEAATATSTVFETQTITAQPAPTAVKRGVIEEDYDMPEYAAACTDIFQYSSACSCVGFTPSTSTAATPYTTSTLTSTVTPFTSTVLSTIETISFTEIGNTIPLTTTTATVTVSQAVETVSVTTTVATASTTEVAYTTVTPVPAPTPTVYITIGEDAFVEDIRIPPGAHIGVILTIRQTILPARLAVDPISGSVDLIQTPATIDTYSLYHYAQNTGYSYLQLTTQRVASIIGVAKARCSLDEAGEFTCLHNGLPAELWLCGRHTAVVFPESGSRFQAACASGARRVNAFAVPV
ncbi:hypothetical protein S40293_08623 [Stachybotrys chartarum IBT 40293]|nr:hypothetical protein S40293_08623 [Stachybotrys chartarum IBT 40293]